jgi:hypothetical protein
MGKDELLADYGQAGKNLHFLISQGILDGPEIDKLQKIIQVLMVELAKYEEEE